MEDCRNALRTESHGQKAKRACSLIAPPVPHRPRLQQDFTLVERFLLAVGELNSEIALKDIDIFGIRVGHPTCNAARWDGQDV